MFAHIRRLKERLGTVRKRSWHFQATEMVWGSRASGGKACTYYWVKLQSSLVYIILIFSVSYFIIGPIMLFLGFYPGFYPWAKDEEAGNNFNYDYKRLPGGRRMPFAPWEAAASLGVLAGIYYLAFVNPDLGIMILGLGLIIAACCALAYAVIKSPIRKFIARVWDKACPPLVVVEDENPN